MKHRVAPEFINRIDEIIMFLPLTHDEIRQIVSLQLESFKRKLEKREIQIEFSSDVREFLTGKSYIPEFGARPVKRAIDEHVINMLSLQLLDGSITKARPIIVTCDMTGLKFSNS